jgi:pilus assembly protein CpaB
VGCLALAVLTWLGGRRAAAGDAAPVVVTTQAIAAGAVLVTADLRLARWPRALVPDGAVHVVAQAVSRRSAGPLARGEPITAQRMVGAGLATGLAPGMAATPVEVSPGAAGFVHAGDHVDLIALPTAADGSGVPTTVASGVLVLAVLPPPDHGTGADAAQLVVAADRAIALRLVAGNARGGFTVIAAPP